jgi:hypothetical protein
MGRVRSLRIAPGAQLIACSSRVGFRAEYVIDT